MDSKKWLMDAIEKENEKLCPVIGECDAGKMEIRAFLLEHYLEAIKNDPTFDNEVYHALGKLVDWRMFSATVHEGEDKGEVERQLQTVVMMDKMLRGG